MNADFYQTMGYDAVDNVFYFNTPSHYSDGQHQELVPWDSDHIPGIPFNGTMHDAVKQFEDYVQRLEVQAAEAREALAKARFYASTELK